jgi:hypothetical protein
MCRGPRERRDWSAIVPSDVRKSRTVFLYRSAVPRDVRRALLGNHSSKYCRTVWTGNASPITRDLMRPGAILKIPVLDHIVIGNPRHSSLRELGNVDL